MDFDLRAEPAFQLLGRGAQREIGLRADQVDDRLGLRQIHLAVQKGALGKFARPRGACSGAQTGFEHARRHQNSAVTADLDQIFAGVTGRRAMHREHDLIDHSIRFDDLAEALDVRWKLGRLPFPAKNAIGDRDRFLARDADQGDRAFAGRRGDRRDRVSASTASPQRSRRRGCSRLPSARRCIVDFAPSSRPKFESTRADGSLSTRAR